MNSLFRYIILSLLCDYLGVFTKSKKPMDKVLLDYFEIK